MPGDLGADRGDDTRVLFHFAREAAGATRARHSPRPSLGERFHAGLGRVRAAGRWKHVPRVWARRSMSGAKMMSCRTGTHPCRGTNGSRFSEAALHAAIHARDTRRCRHVFARSEATKQSILSLCGAMDCFANARNDGGGLLEIELASAKVASTSPLVGEHRPPLAAVLEKERRSDASAMSHRQMRSG